LEQLPTFYQNSNIEVKREVVSSIFSQTIQIPEKGSRTPKINEAVLLITATDKGSSKKKGTTL
jgi:hypothetical protein